MLVGKFSQQARQEVGRNRRNGCQADSSRFVGLRQLSKRVFYQRHDLLSTPEQQLSQFRQHNIAWLTFKQRLPNLLLQPLNRTAECRLTQPYLFGGAGEVSLFRNSQKVI